jgi:hypothetical protein
MSWNVAHAAVDAGRGQRGLELSVVPLRVERRAPLRMREHVVLVRPVGRRREVLDEAGDEGGGESDAALALLGLRLLDAERPLDEVDVPPAQTPKLLPA